MARLRYTENIILGGITALILILFGASILYAAFQAGALLLFTAVLFNMHKLSRL